MADFQNKHRRLAGYDYGSAGAYFVTLVCDKRRPLLTNSRFREIVETSWLWLADQYEHVALDEFIVMPNHFHGILWISTVRSGASRGADGSLETAKPLGQLIGAFKTASTKKINLLRNSPGAPLWQRNFYDRIVRNEEELSRIREYVLNNPRMWDEDPENPAAALSTCAAISASRGATTDPR